MYFLKHNLKTLQGAREEFKLPRLDYFILYGSTYLRWSRILGQNMCYILLLLTYFDYEYKKNKNKKKLFSVLRTIYEALCCDGVWSPLIIVRRQLQR